MAWARLHLAAERASQRYCKFERDVKHKNWPHGSRGLEVVAIGEPVTALSSPFDAEGGGTVLKVPPPMVESIERGAQRRVIVRAREPSGTLARVGRPWGRSPKCPPRGWSNSPPGCKAVPGSL